MITELRIEGRGTIYTYNLDLPLIPEGTLLSTPKVAAVRIVCQTIRINNDDTAKQYLVAR